jgi:hypothetical protein
MGDIEPTSWYLKTSTKPPGLKYATGQGLLPKQTNLISDKLIKSKLNVTFVPILSFQSKIKYSESTWWKFSPKKQGALDNKGLLMKIQTLLIACSTLILAACGGGGPGGLTVLPNGDLTVASGSAQKGPFIAGSTVTLNTLTDTSPNPVAAASSATKPFLAPSGRSFTLETDSTGTFDSTALTFLASEKFIQANVEGYFFDEITGLRSDDYIALRGVVDITTQKLQINILTDLAKARTVKLARDQVATCSTATAAKANCTLDSAEFTTARTQAEKEVLQALNIPIRLLGDSFTSFANMNFKNIANTSFLSSPAASDQVLLALSALVVQIGKDGAGITEFINAFEADLAADGRLDDADLKAQISRASSTVNFSMVARNMNAYYKSNKYAADDLRKWVDPSGGLNGVIAAQSEYYNMDTTKTTTAYTAGTLSITGSGNGTCLAMSSVSAASQLLVTSTATGTVPTAIVANTSYFVAAGVKPTFQLRSTPSSLNGQAKVVMWDATSATAAGCATTATTVQTGIYFFAATPSNLNLFATKFISDFAKCFTLTATNRVKSVDLSNPDIPNVTDVNDLCKPLAGSETKEYLHNGYKAGQNYYYPLVDGGMTKTAKITGMDVVNYFAGKDEQQVAIILFTYMDRFNKKGVMSVVATQDPALTSTNTAGWYNTGNQQPVDINLIVGLRKYVSIPLFTVTAAAGTAAAANVNKTIANVKVRYQSGFLPGINSKGPGTVLADGSKLSAVVITGPGLPDAGLVFIPPLQRGQSNFDFSNVTGTLPGTTPANQQTRCGYTPQFVTAPSLAASAPSTSVLTPSPATCELSWVGQTTWAAPSKTVAPTMVTTQPTGSVWLPNNGWNLMTAGTEYLFKLYYGTRTTPTHTYTKRLLTSMPDLTKAHLQTWVDLDKVGEASLQGALATATATPATLNPFESFRPLPSQTSMYVNWTGQVQNQLEISSINTNLQMAHYPRASPGDSVARGYAEGTLQPQLDQDGIAREMQWTANLDTMKQPVTGLTTDMTLPLSRTISMSYRSWDHSWKSQDYFFLTNSP